VIPDDVSHEGAHFVGMGGGCLIHGHRTAPKRQPLRQFSIEDDTRSLSKQGNYQDPVASTSSVRFL
jgi:hypothetical protein